MGGKVKRGGMDLEKNLVVIAAGIVLIILVLLLWFFYGHHYVWVPLETTLEASV